MRDRLLSVSLILILFFAFLALYSSMAAPGLDWGDAGEAQLAAWTAGLSHPTGYPLFLIGGWLWTHALALIGVAPTRAMTLLSATVGAAAVALVVPTVHALLRRARLRLKRKLSLLIATLAAITFGLSQTFWSQALLAEVYTLNALFLVLLLWGLWEEGIGRQRLLGLALLYGLAIGHHRLMLLWLPGLLLWGLVEFRTRYGVTGLPRSGSITLPFLLLLIALVLLPQILYLYIPLRGPVTPYLHQPLTDDRQLILYDGTVNAFLAHSSGTVFASNLLNVSLSERLRTFGRLWRENVGVLTLFAIPGLLHFRLGESRQIGLPLSDRLLLLSGGALTLLFGLVYGIGDIEVMFIPLWLVLIILGFVGITVLWRRFGARGPRWIAAALAIVVLLVLGERLAQRPPSRATLDAPRQLVNTILETDPPENAIIVFNDRDEAVPFWYAQFAEGQRRDLLSVFPLITSGPEHRTVNEVVEWALQWGRPVLLSKPMPSLSLRYDVEPYAGPLVAVEGRAEMPTDPVLQGELAPELSVVGWHPSARRVLAAETVTVTVGLRPNEPITQDLSFSLQLFHENGLRVGQEDISPDPFFPPQEWSVGEPLRLSIPLTIPEEVDPGLYEWRLSAYDLQEEAIPVGQQVTLGRFLVGAAPPPLAMEALERPIAQFGEEIILVDATWPEEAPQPGETLDFLLRWTALDAPLRPYTLFVHLVNEAGEIVAQADAPPDPPTDTWVRGDTWSDVRVLPLPDSLPSGRYTLRIGLYDATGRLPVQDGGDAVELFTMEIRADDRE
ncbi:MAG: DUF2723 domain-containing protein [Chloroflexota bacterium]|nr:DUF2723 domain-containing protein [Chloroflexota bacterium]